MLTDEQLREQFEDIRVAEYGIGSVDIDPETGEYTRRSTYEAWGHFQAGWAARDAEVQALREELLNYVSADEMAVGEGYGTYPNSEHRRIRALVAGGETGGTE